MFSVALRVISVLADLSLVLIMFSASV